MSAIQIDGYDHFFIRIPIRWPRSEPFFWQNPCSGCNSGISLVVTLEYTFFRLSSNAKQTYARSARFRRSYEKHPAVVLTRPTSCTDFFVWCALRCSKWSRSFFCSCSIPMIVYLWNLFLLNTPLARMLLTPRWVSSQKDEKMCNSYP